MFFEFATVPDECQPKIFQHENISQLLSKTRVVLHPLCGYLNDDIVHHIRCAVDRLVSNLTIVSGNPILVLTGLIASIGSFRARHAASQAYMA